MQDFPDTLYDLIELRSTWQESDGKLWTIDHLIDNNIVCIRPDWTVSFRYPDRFRKVRKQDLIKFWRRIESREQRLARQKFDRDLACQLSRHDDPDNSGLCIHCGKELD